MWDENDIVDQETDLMLFDKNEQEQLKSRPLIAHQPFKSVIAK